MSKKTKFTNGLAIALLFGVMANGQSSVLELTTGAFNSLSVPGSGFGPDSSRMVATFEKDLINNSHFTTYTTGAGNAVTTTFAFQNQRYTGLGYGGTYPVSTGLVFGGAPSLSTGGNVQEVDPLNRFEILGFGASGGPRNEMFMSASGMTPNTFPYPTQNGVGINARGGVPGAEDRNAGAQVFTAAQALFPTAQPYGSTDRYYFGDLVITFSQFVTNPVIHIAGLGGSYRYLPTTAPTADTSNYLSAFFSTELQVSPGFSLTKMSGNEFLTVSGSDILNSSARPNGESFYVAPTNNLTHNNYGAASGSVRINGPVRVVIFKIYLRGSNSSQFGWSSAGIGVVAGATRAPLTGDIWNISASFEPEQLITLPSTGVNLTAALNGNDVLLKWKTQTEVNSKNFEIERSTDGINFTAIGVKSAAGNSVSQINYSEVDPNMNASVYYYRLKLVDIDGKFTYSNIAQVRKSGSIKSVKMFPNPAASQINLEFSNAKGSYMVSLYNQAGQEVFSQKSNITYGVQYVTINRNSLASGNYFVKVKSSDNTEVLFAEKVVLQ